MALGVNVSGGMAGSMLLLADDTLIKLGWYVMTLLDTVGEDTNVFVISHKGDQLFDKFRSLIKFEKKNNYSEMVV